MKDSYLQIIRLRDHALETLHPFEGSIYVAKEKDKINHIFTQCETAFMDIQNYVMSVAPDKEKLKEATTA